MANLIEKEQWEDVVPQVENGEPVDGGDDGPIIKMVRKIANRTLWLKRKYDQLIFQFNEFELSWEKIDNKPEVFPVAEHYHYGLVPIGGIIGWTKSTPPEYGEWIICDGQNDTPNIKGRVIVGAGATFDGTIYRVGDIGGEEIVSLSAAQNGPHSHKNRVFSFGGDNGNEGSVSDSRNSFPQGRTFANGNYRDLRNRGYNFENSNEINESGEGQPHNNMQPYIVFNWIMRVK